MLLEDQNRRRLTLARGEQSDTDQPVAVPRPGSLADYQMQLMLLEQTKKRSCRTRRGERNPNSWPPILTSKTRNTSTNTIQLNPSSAWQTSQSMQRQSQQQPMNLRRLQQAQIQGYINTPPQPYSQVRFVGQEVASSS